MRVALVAALLTAVAFALLTPPFQVPDEVSHYWRSRALAIGRTGGVSPDGRVGDSVPLEAKGLVAATWSELDAGTPYDPNRLVSARRVRVQPRPLVFVRIPSVVYTPAPYLPQTSATWITDLLRVQPLVAFYIGRLAVLLAAAVCVQWSLRVAGERRWALVPVVCAPMTLFLAGSYSGDAMTIAAALLFTGLVAAAASLEEPLAPRELRLLTFSAVLLALCKAYVPLLLLLAAIPSRRFRGGRAHFRAAALFVIALALALLVSAHFASFARHQRRDARTDVARQQQIVADDPQRFLALAARDLRENGRLYAEEAVGRLGRLEVALPAAAMWCHLAATAWVALCLVPRLQWRFRLLALLLVTTMVVLIQLSQYLSWTAVGQASIEGVQGRYFLPLVPSLLLALAMRRRAWRHVAAEWLPALCFVAIDAVSIVRVVRRYWM